MTYAEAMARYGTDKPDLRFGLELVECTDYFADTPFRVFQAPYVGAVVMPGGASPAAQAARRLAGLGQAARRARAWPTCSSARTASSAARSPRTSPTPSGPAWPRTSAPSRATASSSPPAPAQAVPGAARCRPARDRPARRADRRVGVVVRVGRRRAAVRAGRRRDRGRRRRGRRRRLDRRAPRVHRRRSRSASTRSTPTPATRWPTPTTSSATATRSAAARSVSTARDVQERVFAVMGLGEEEAQEKFGFLLDAFAYGAPPHGGIAFGWDRICALLAGHRLDPRRHRVPEDRRRLRPAHRRAGADHRRAAQGGRRRRPRPHQGLTSLSWASHSARSGPESDRQHSDAG